MRKALLVPEFLNTPRTPIINTLRAPTVAAREGKNQSLALQHTEKTCWCGELFLNTMFISTKIGIYMENIFEVIFDCMLNKECNRLLLNSVLLMPYV